MLDPLLLRLVLPSPPPRRPDCSGHRASGETASSARRFGWRTPPLAFPLLCRSRSARRVSDTEGKRGFVIREHSGFAEMQFDAWRRDD